MAQTKIKKVNIYMGVIGQAYVDKEQALSNLNAAIKNVHDMEDIIQMAKDQRPNVIKVKTNAQQAKVFAQAAADKINEKLNGANSNDLLYKQLNYLKNELIDNDYDNDPYNGGNVNTADNNIAYIDSLGAELESIIIDALDSLQRRNDFVDELQVIYDNAVEVFESYFPVDSEIDWDSWDEEEERLKARIQAVIDGLDDAQNITNIINKTSKEVIEKAINIILSVTENNKVECDSVLDSRYTYRDTLNSLYDQLNELTGLVNELESSESKSNLLNNIYSSKEQINTLLSSLSEIESLIDNSSYGVYNKLNNISDRWNDIKAIIDENVEETLNDNDPNNDNIFDVNEFSATLDDLYNANESIKTIKTTLNSVKRTINNINSSINRFNNTYNRLLVSSGSSNNDNPEGPTVSTISKQLGAFYTDLNGVLVELRIDQTGAHEDENIHVITTAGELIMTGNFVNNGRANYWDVINKNAYFPAFYVVNNGNTVISPRITITSTYGGTLTFNMPAITPKENNNGNGNCYLYIGTVKPTSLNEALRLNSYESEYPYTNESDIKSPVYVLVNGDKNVTIKDTIFNSDISLDTVDTTTVPGYNIFKTAVGIASEGTVKVIISNGNQGGNEQPDQPTPPSGSDLYFYVGTTKPTSLSQAQTVTSYPTEQTYTNNSGAKAQIYVLTNSNKTVTIHEPNTGAALNVETDTTSISGYNITYTTGRTANTGSVKIRIL